MRITRGALAAVLLIGLVATGCSDADPDGPAPPTYSCCPDEDLTAVYRPGQTVTLHWSVEPPPGAEAGPPDAELTASLAGPFATEQELKTGATPPAVLAAEPLRPTGEEGEEPVSVIALGPDVRPGLYNLTTTITRGDSAVESASVIRVAG